MKGSDHTKSLKAALERGRSHEDSVEEGRAKDESMEGTQVKSGGRPLIAYRYEDGCG